MPRAFCFHAGAPALAAVLALSSAEGFASCGSAFCAINTDWSLQGVWTEPGARLDLRHEYIDQDQPMAGRRKVRAGEIPRHHDEVRTVNRNWLGTLDYAFGPTSGASLVVPWVDRRHFHIHNHQGAQLPESWDFSALGDVRLLGRRQVSAEHDAEHRLNTFGVNFGLKLPTGKFDVANQDGDKAERSLQPGSGTTDALLGGYFRQVPPAQGASWFVQGLFQNALNTRAGFRPGDRWTLDLGMRYPLSANTGLSLQLNALFRDRDSGLEAEPEDSGGRSVFLSPGISYALTRDLQLYGFVQLPLYQQVNGVQLVASWATAAGVSGRF